MAVIRLSSLSKLNPLWLCFIVELLFSFVYIPMAINAQLIHQQQSTLTNDKAAMMTNDDHNQHSFASLMIANDFCKFIFNVINDDDDEGDDVVSNDNQQFTNGHIEPLNRSKKMIRSIFEMNEEDTPSIITTPHVNHRHHHNHHLHYSHTHPSAVTTTPLPSSNLNSNDSLKESSSSTSLPLTVFPKRNNTKESSISSTTSSTFEDDKIRNPVSTQKSSYSRLSLNSNDENSIKHAEKKWPFPAVRQKRERNLKDTSGYKKNPYHYSYSPPSNSHPVYIGLEILDIDRINDAENYFSIQLYLFEMWEEPRLNTTALRYWSRKSGPIPVLEANMASCIWTPSLIFEDSTEKEHLLPPTSILLANPEMNRSLVLLRKSRYSLKVRCHMNLQIYPMDKHSCHFKIRTFTDPVRKVSLKWLSDSGSPKPDLLDENRNEIIYSNEFAPSLFDIRVQRPAGKYRITWLNDHYSMLDVEFIFERRIIHSLLTVYIPSSLIVVLSWLQFWFDVEAVPGRMSLGIMSTLTIMTQILTNYEKAGNHVTAVDIWLFVCLIMVFLALMEYALAYTISHYYDNFDDDLDDVCDGVDVDHNNNSNNKKLVEFDSKEPMLMANTDIDALIFDRLKSNPTSTNCVPISATVNQQATGIHHSNNNNNNQVTPMKTSSLPADILLNENRITSPTTSDRIIQAQQQIHKASQELETILTERYAETLNMIRSTQRSVRDAQRLQLTLSLIEQQQHQQQPKMNENDNSKYQLHQRKSAFNNSSSNKQQSAKPIPTTGRKSRRLSRFRQSLRRQISSRNQRMNRNRLNAGGYDGQRSKLSEVDYCSRYLFPFSFVLFAIGYWIALIYYKLIS